MLRTWGPRKEIEAGRTVFWTIFEVLKIKKDIHLSLALKRQGSRTVRSEARKA